MGSVSGSTFVRGRFTVLEQAPSASGQGFAFGSGSWEAVSLPVADGAVCPLAGSAEPEKPPSAFVTAYAAPRTTSTVTTGAVQRGTGRRGPCSSVSPTLK